MTLRTGKIGMCPIFPAHRMKLTHYRLGGSLDSVTVKA